MKTFFARIGAYLKASWTRFNTESPKYWKVLQRLFTWVSATTLLISDYAQYVIIQLTGYGIDLPPQVQVIAGHIATAAFLARLVAGLAVNPNVISERKYEKLNDPSSTVPTAQ